MRRFVSRKTTTSIALLVLAGGAAALLIWSLRKRKARLQDAAATEAHLEHTSPESGYSRWSASRHTNATGSLGAASH